MLSGIALPVFAEGEKAVMGHSRYAVEFFYGEKEYIMSGGYDVMLSYVLEELGISGELQSWAVSDPALFNVVLYDDIPVFLSLRQFDTTEWLKVVVDGAEYDITVTDDNTTQNVPYLEDGFYADALSTYLDGTVSVTEDTYYQTHKTPAPSIVKQPKSTTTTLYDFAAGLPLSTIYIDETKFGDLLGTFAWEIDEDVNEILRDAIVYTPATNYVYCDPTKLPDGHFLNGAPTVLNGPLFSFTFTDAAILQDGTRANVKMLFSNAQIFTDERLKAMEDVAREHLADAEDWMEIAMISGDPEEIAAAQEAIDAAQAELAASYYAGMAVLAHDNNVSYGGTDDRDLTSTKSGFSQEQIDAASEAYTARINQYKSQEALSGIPDAVYKYPATGKSIDVTYQVIDNNGDPVNGTFIFAMVGINLERDPYRINSVNACKGLWWVHDNYPDMHFLNEQIAVTNSTIASDYIYVRANNTEVEPLNPGHTETSVPSEKRTGYYPQIVEVEEDGVKKTKIIANAYQASGDSTNYGGNDGYYSSGFVTLARSGFTITAYGHGYGDHTNPKRGGGMNTQAYGAPHIWYRYVSESGPHGNIQTTTEGNYEGKLSDTSDSGKDAEKLDPAAYVVPEGKTVTYTMMPENNNYHINKLWVKNENGRMQEIKFNGRPLYTMLPGQVYPFRDAAGKLCTLTAHENGVFTLEMPYAQHDEWVRVEWEGIMGQVTVKKETFHDESGSFNFNIRASKSEDVTTYGTGTEWDTDAVGSVWVVGGVCYAEFGGIHAEPADAAALGALVSEIMLIDRIEISGGKYLWKTDKKLSDLGLASPEDDDDLFVSFLFAESCVIGDTLDDTLNNQEKRIYFFNPRTATENVTTHWNFEEGKSQSDPIVNSFTLVVPDHDPDHDSITFEVPRKYKYEVWELPVGWELMSIDGVKGASIAAASLTDEHYAFEHTFLNRKLPDLTVEKQTLPDGAQDTFVFTVEIKSLPVDAQTGTVLATAGVIEGVIGYSFENPGDPFAVDGIIVPSGSFGFGQNTQLDTVCNKLLDLSSAQDIRLGAEEGTVVSSETQALRDWAEEQTVDGTRTVQFAFASPSKEVQPYKLPAPFAGADYDAESGLYTFTLHGGDKLAFPDIPYGYTYAVTEGDLPEDWVQVSETNASGTLDTDKTALFVNEKHGVFIPETGIYTDSLPYVLALGFVVMCFAGIVFRIRRKARIDE